MQKQSANDRKKLNSLDKKNKPKGKFLNENFNNKQIIKN